MGKIYLLNDEIFEGTINLPMIKINYLLKEVNLKPYDSLIFTSKNAVRALNKIDSKWIEKEIYSIGQGTSKEIQKHSTNLVFTSKNSYGNMFAKDIKHQLSGKKVLFLRAKKVTSNLNGILRENGINLDEEILYETLCQSYEANCQPPSNSIIIFTSASTVKCFFQNFKWNSGYKAVVIGTTTAAAIPKNIKKHIATNQTLQSCVDLAKSLCNFVDI